MAARGPSLPGFDPPAVGFEQPFEMLEACHERVRRSLALLLRLIEHVDAHGHDAQSRSAATDVQRYFDLAAPHHHEDEELHVFAVLRGGEDAALAADIDALERDHEAMEALWSRLRLALVRWRAPGEIDPIAAAERAAAQTFVALYRQHLEVEEARVFPAARARLDAEALARMGAEMQARRRGPR
jgi:hemerythrin-like domain-containing protein